MTLTPKQEAFAQAFVSLGDASAAYRHAYSVGRMSAKTVNEEASKLLHHPKVSPRIDELRRAIEERSIMSAVEIQRKLTNIARARLSDIVSWGPDGLTVISSADLTPEALDAVASVKVKRRRIWIGSGEAAMPWELEEIEIKPHDPQAAMRELARLKGLHAPERHEHSGPRGGPIRLEHGTKAEFDYDGYAELFGQHLAGAEPGAARPDGAEEPLDSPDADAEAGALPGGSTA